MDEKFEPTIAAFLCNWCTFTAADLAGTSRLSYPQNVKIRLQAPRDAVVSVLEDDGFDIEVGDSGTPS